MKAIQYIRLIGKEFISLTDAELHLWVEMVRPMVSRKQFGKLYEQAIAYLVCHKLKMAGYGENPLGDMGAIGIGFAVGSVSEGGSSISFGANQSSNLATDAELGLTAYGVQFLQLRRMVIVPIHCSGELDSSGGKGKNNPCKFYLQSEKNGGLTHPDYVGACVLNKLDECMKLSEVHQEYIRKEKEKIAAEEAEKRRREAEEINAKAKQEIEAAVKIIREGGRLNNDRIDYRVGDVGHNEPIVLLLMRRYKVGVPLRTQGWICSKLANVTIKDGRCDGLQYYKAKGAACSQRFFDCMNELVQKVIQEEAK